MSFGWIWPFGRRSRRAAEQRLEQERRQLAAARERLLALVRPSTRLSFRQLEEDDKMTPAMSHAGGAPYAEAGDDWPPCSGCGEPLEHIVQVDLRRCPVRPTTAYDLVVLFYCLRCFPWGIDREREAGQWLVRTYRAPDDGRAIALEPPARGVADTCAIDAERFDMLPLWDELVAHDRVLAETLDTIDDGWEVLVEDLAEFVPEQNAATTVGGYPLWVQSDDAPVARDGAERRRFELLLQLDSEPVPGWMWGDAGMLYLFIDPGDPHDVRLVVQCH
ncbi:MAG: DUF1963 domain-containing protein [Acidobacteriota bacterium]